MRVKSSGEPRAPVRILAVDDLESNLIALQAAISDPAYELHCVDSGMKAIEAARDEEFALVLLDVQMPGIDGFETAKLLRKNAKSARTPIIFLTAIYQDEQFVERGYFEGAVDYIYKPLNISILRSKISVFVDLFRKTKEIERQAALDKELALKEQEIRFLKAAVANRDEFMSIASHELKTPLTPLLLQVQRFRELIESGEIKSLPQMKLVKMWDIAQSQVRRLSRLVNDLLDLTRIVEGRLQLDPTEIDLAELVRGVVEEFEADIKKAQCELHLDLASGVVGRWDAPRIEQIVINLLSNSLRYAAGKKIEIKVASAGDEAVIEVADDGIGIAPADQSRIFGRFERAVSNGHYGGLGLGLFISKNIVLAHRGTISVSSELGKGAVFTVRVPAAL